MLHTLKLLLPALFPSWRFFDIIAPSPRIQYALFDSAEEIVSEWQEFRPRPERVSFRQMLGRMVWNPGWNESLFLVSCAERLIEFPTWHSENEILVRINNELTAYSLQPEDKTATQFQFRLVVIKRQEKQLLQEVVFHSRKEALEFEGCQ